MGRNAIISQINGINRLPVSTISVAIGLSYWDNRGIFFRNSENDFLLFFYFAISRVYNQTDLYNLLIFLGAQRAINVKLGHVSLEIEMRQWTVFHIPNSTAM